MKKLILKILMLLCSGIVFSNNSIDSLLNKLKHSKSDTEQVNLNIKIGQECINILPDSSKYFYDNALKIVNNRIEVISKNDISKSNKFLKNFKLSKADILYKIGEFYYDRGNFGLSVDFYNKALQIFQYYVDEKNVGDCFNEIGLAYLYNGRYPEAINNFFESLKIKEKLSDKKGCSNCYNNIGLVWYNQNNFERASEYYSKSLAIDLELADSVGIAIGYNNIGLSHFFQLNYKKALFFYDNSLIIRKAINDKIGIAETSFNIGILYLDSGLLDISKKYLNDALDIYNKLSNYQGQCAVYRELANLFNVEGDVYKSISYSQECLKIAEKYGLINERRFAHNYLYSSYKSLREFEKALFHHEKYKSLTDSLFNTEKTSQIANMEVLYQNEKKQKEIELLNKDKELQKVEIKRQTTQKYAFIAGFVLMLLIAVLAIFGYRKIKTQNKIIEHKNNELSQQNEEITSQRDEIEAQRNEITIQKDIAESQRDLIMFQNLEITDSIKYAKRIQDAVLSSFKFIEDLDFKNFVLFKPKDIVSGDFYWFLKRGDNLIVAVADCTGHGVPGAFMSMLGISFLNEIVRRKEITQANQILNNLRIAVVNALQQKGKSGEQKDGMDISLIAIKLQAQSQKTKALIENVTHSPLEKRCAEPVEVGVRGIENTYEAQWAGANNPLWIVQGNKNLTGFENLLGLKEVKPDKMPISIYERMDDFTNHKIQLHAGDTLYLMSDGYEDQFGGTKGKKFLSKNLKQLLVDNCGMNMNQQKEKLNSTFENWRGNHEQIDDVTVLGIRI